MILHGKKILLGVTGGIAAYKSCLILREFQKLGAEIRVVMTEAGNKMVGFETFQALTKHPVYIDTFSDHPKSFFQHIDIAKWADIYLIAPCTANTIANIAHGNGSDSVSLSYLSTSCPKVIAPAMNSDMFAQQVVQDNLKKLEEYGATIIDPEYGRMACGDLGPGRLPALETIIDATIDLLLPPPTKGQVLITAGRTEEAIDTVRYISNKSSGKTAVAIAEAFRAAGYAVTVVNGPMEARLPVYIDSISVRTAQEMFEATTSFDADIYIMAAAVADFRVTSPSDQKIKGSSELTELSLVRNPDILAHVAEHRTEEQKVIGFALETENPIKYACTKLASKKCDAIFVNTPIKHDSGIGFDSAEGALITPQSTPDTLTLMSKSAIAQTLVEFCNG
ncbi:MAG: bifunctional phosphopantothenoylcysteine decarboxylase/phosphopantothenate--cysteine ligase CoaBC [Fibrobacterales bacterium]